MSHSKAIKTIKILSSIGEDSPKSLYAERLRRNVRGVKRRKSIDHTWNGLLLSILTSQQRSTGKSNRVRELLDSGWLRWEIAINDPASITRTVKGFNYNERKKSYLRTARRWLLKNVEELDEYKRALRRIPVHNIQERYAAEVDAADFLRKGVDGIGPKQSRNFWQYLGYSVWTIPFDSRIRTILESPPSLWIQVSHISSLRNMLLLYVKLQKLSHVYLTLRCST